MEVRFRVLCRRHHSLGQRTQDRNQLAATGFQSVIQRRDESGPSRCFISKPRVARREPGRDGACRVRRSVIDDDAFPVRQALQLYTAQAGVERLRAVERWDQNRDTRILADHFSRESLFFVTGRPVSPYNVACYTAVTNPVDSSEHDNHVRSMFRKC